MARRSGWDAGAALAAVGLWEARNQAFDDLTPGQRAAAAVLPCLLSEEALAVIDGHLDGMDPWTLPRLLEHLAGQASAKAFVVATGRPDVAEALGQMLVLSNGTPVFVGRTSDLVRAAGPVEVLVETDDPSTVRSMVEPLAVSVKAVAGGLVVRTERGQETAAKLLTQGYGSVRALVVREATVAEALARLV
jgi:ABC-type multidrug transport system ATPase subunit